MVSEKLREVEAKLWFSDDKKKHGEVVTGYFHRFITYRDEDGEDTYALVELQNGEMVETLVTYIRFLDRNRIKSHFCQGCGSSLLINRPYCSDCEDKVYNGGENKPTIGEVAKEVFPHSDFTK